MKRQVLLIAAGICGLATSSHASLVSWYKFDEGADATTAVNSVSGGPDGSILFQGSGAVFTGVAGISGNAYEFVGGGGGNNGGYVDMGNANFFSSITASGQLTLTAWVQTNVTTANRNVVIFAGDDQASQTYVDLGYSGTGDGAIAPGGPGSAYGRVRPNNISSSPGVTGAWSANPVNDGQWNHLAMTVDLSVSPQVSLYVNGVLQSTITLTSPNDVFPVFNNFEVGRLGRSAPTDYYTGLIDDVQVYDSALSGSDILFLYDNPGVAVPEPGAIALAGLGLGVLYLRSRRKNRG